MRLPRLACPACGFVVFEEEPGSYELCPVCNWENDGVQYEDPNYRGGANGRSLVEEQARTVRRFPYGTWQVERWLRDPWWRPLMEAEVAAGRDAIACSDRDGPFVPYWLRSPLGIDTALTTYDWYDGPIAGTANVDGRPHLFDATFDASADEWDHGRFELRPIDDTIVKLVIEDAQIWTRWSDARLRGEDVMASHPTLPVDRARHEAIRDELTRLRAALPEPFMARPTWFWPPTPPGPHGWLAVRWERLA